MKELEIELKAYCDDHLALISRLIAVGGKFIKRMEENDTYFNHPCRNFIDTDEALRIRKRKDDIILTYKGPRLEGKAKSRVEEEVPVSDFRKMKEILINLGFKGVREVVKTRDLYRVDDISICLDIVEGLGEFVELEKMGSDREKIEGQLLELAARLGLSRFEEKSYLELLEEKG